jgi:hypothetical protein
MARWLQDGWPITRTKELVMRHCLILSILLGGCLVDLGNSGSAVEGDEADGAGGGDNDECKIEGGQIGRDGVAIQLGSKTVTFGNWVGKSGSPGEYVGFSLTLAGGSAVSYVVKSGGERAPSTSLTWVHAAGPGGGSNAPGISNVDFCNDPDAGGGGGDCNGGDGCPDGGGDGGGDDGPIIL